LTLEKKILPPRWFDHESGSLPLSYPRIKAKKHCGPYGMELKKRKEKKEEKKKDAG